VASFHETGCRARAVIPGSVRENGNARITASAGTNMDSVLKSEIHRLRYKASAISQAYCDSLSRSGAKDLTAEVYSAMKRRLDSFLKWKPALVNDEIWYADNGLGFNPALSVPGDVMLLEAPANEPRLPLRTSASSPSSSPA